MPDKDLPIGPPPAGQIDDFPAEERAGKVRGSALSGHLEFSDLAEHVAQGVIVEEEPVKGPAKSKEEP